MGKTFVCTNISSGLFKKKKQKGKQEFFTGKRLIDRIEKHLGIDFDGDGLIAGVIYIYVYQ